MKQLIFLVLTIALVACDRANSTPRPPMHGTLFIEASGAPRAITVTVTGPNGYYETGTTPVFFRNLGAGQYWIRPESLQGYRADTFIAVVTGQADATNFVTITYTRDDR